MRSVAATGSPTDAARRIVRCSLRSWSAMPGIAGLKMCVVGCGPYGSAHPPAVHASANFACAPARLNWPEPADGAHPDASLASAAMRSPIAASSSGSTSRASLWDSSRSGRTNRAAPATSSPTCHSSAYGSRRLTPYCARQRVRTSPRSGRRPASQCVTRSPVYDPPATGRLHDRPRVTCAACGRYVSLMVPARGLRSSATGWSCMSTCITGPTCPLRAEGRGAFTKRVQPGRTTGAHRGRTRPAGAAPAWARPSTPRRSGCSTWATERPSAEASR